MVSKLIGVFVLVVGALAYVSFKVGYKVGYEEGGDDMKRSAMYQSLMTVKEEYDRKVKVPEE
ncbi:hypothetical protein K1728_01920 [Weissella confusa]|uniref:hypothetical protein n=1 Tax=Weissella confusa TaxID=1583 RepID=UPI001C6FBD13|nr:hypothetical protein [Weissella confusa]QYU58195.1 hypothetical protein K1728_01920 [Weissella confusa]